MPQVIGALILSVFGVGAAAGFTIAGVTVTYAAIVGATVLAAAAYALGGLLLPSLPKATDGQLTLQQPIPFRRRIYGRTKIGGYFVFWTSKDGTLYSLVAIAGHEIDGVEEIWLGDRQVELDGSGNVTSVVAPANADPNQFNPRGGHPVQVFYRLGTSGQSTYSQLTSAFSGIWTSQHVGIGIADVLTIQASVKQEDFANTYPGGNQPVRLVVRGAKIQTATSLSPPSIAWQDNAISVIMDYLQHQDGWRISTDHLYNGQGIVATEAAAAIADEFVTLKNGGAERRYRIWGFYDFSDEPRAVLARMLAACGGWLTSFPDGTIGINAGAWQTPSVTISDEHILGFEVQHFVGEFDVINEIRANFTDPDNDYQDTESSPWQDAADIALRGYIKSTNIDARYCPSYTQTRRVQKIAYEEANPEYTITLTTDAYGLAARGQRFINLVIDKLGVSGTFRLTSFVANLQTGVCTMGLASFPSSAYDWDPATEEGDPPPIPPDTSAPGGIETPTNLDVVVATQTVSGGTSGAIMQVSCDPPSGRNDLSVRFEYQPTGDSSWTQITSGTQVFSCQTQVLTAGRYNVRASFIGPNGAQGPYAEVDNVDVSATPSAPDAPSSLTANLASPPTSVVLVAQAPNSANVSAIEFWRNSTSSFSTATNISGPVYCSPNQAVSYTDSPGSGTWYYWATALSSVSPVSRSSPTGPQSVTI